MTRLPSLDDYDLQDVRFDEAALWGDDVRDAVDDIRDLFRPEWFIIDAR
ncbi:hypothetical protein ACIP88_05220 [Streptomyces uncialis]